MINGESGDYLLRFSLDVSTTETTPLGIKDTRKKPVVFSLTRQPTEDVLAQGGLRSGEMICSRSEHGHQRQAI